MDSSYWFYTVDLGWSVVYIEGTQVIISTKYRYSFFEDHFSLANSAQHIISSGSALIAKVSVKGFLVLKGLI